MPRVISQSFRSSVLAQNSGHVTLLFAELNHPDWATPLRFVSDTSDYVWNGNTYLGAIFDVQILTDNDNPPTAQFTFPNIDRSIGELISSTVMPPTIRMDILHSGFFDLTVNPRVPIGAEPTPEYTAQNLWIADVSVDAVQVSGRIVSLDLAREGAHRFRCTKERTPALFR